MNRPDDPMETMQTPPDTFYQTPIGIKKRVLYTLQTALYRSGLAKAYTHFRKPSGTVILMYHSVAAASDAQWIDPRNHMSPATFERQMQFLARRRRVITLDELVDSLGAGRTQPGGTVVITLDDGYLDNLTVAAPILDRFHLPATLYLATGYVDHTENQWVDQAYALFRFRTRHRLAVPGNPTPYDLQSHPSLCAAYQAFCGQLLGARSEARRQLLADATAQLLPEGDPPRLTLSWEEVRTMRRQFPAITMGTHTQRHVDLSAMSPGEVASEIQTCTHTLFTETNEKPRHFSFPYNRHTREAGEILAGSGYVSAVASGPDCQIRPGADPYALPRIEAASSHALMGFHTSGAYPGLSLLLTGRQ